MEIIVHLSVSGNMSGMKVTKRLILVVRGIDCFWLKKQKVLVFLLLEEVDSFCDFQVIHRITYRLMAGEVGNTPIAICK